ncbi:MAG TPA: carboxypeptidase-like regulatory domain-containing protein [Bryobacteraceae bacterium]|nr:carboxypeptidase-like regulatory domain-containing protein [Bryobacteraceae bacterium]
MNINGRLMHSGGPIINARVEVIDQAGRTVAFDTTQNDGTYTITGVSAGQWLLRCKHFTEAMDRPMNVVEGQNYDAGDWDLGLDAKLVILQECDCKWEPAAALIAGQRCMIQLKSNCDNRIHVTDWKCTPPTPFAPSMVVPNAIELLPRAGSLLCEASFSEKGGQPRTNASSRISAQIQSWQPEATRVDGAVAIKGPAVNVRLQRPASDPTLDQALWVAIRDRSRALSFDRYQDFMNRALNWEERRFEVPPGLPKDARGRVEKDLSELGIHMHGVAAYQTLKHLTELFLLMECGVRIRREDHQSQFDPELDSRRLGQKFSIDEIEMKLYEYLGKERAQLPYITRIVRATFPELQKKDPDSSLLFAKRINEPCLIELMWSYWMEEGMLVQTINAITRRFQNMRGGRERDPLANLEIDPLRPLNNLLWGYIQDEFNRLSVRRRAFEYDHQYGLTLYGKATAGIQGADSRSKFLEAFHNLLHQTSIFFKEDFQTTVIADGFPLLNALREVHLILAQGAHNQFGDLPWTARVEMMLSQYMLARPEIRSFLQGRVMVPYREPWESQVDTMKTLQGWTDVTVSHFRDLAVYGEQLLLSIRYGDWIADNDEYSAINWARFFRPEIQGYLHAYRAATGVDLTAETATDKVDATIPGILLQKRASMHRAR